MQRVKLVSQSLEQAGFASIVESANRVSRISKETVEKPVNANLFNSEAETNLFNQINKISEESYESLIKGLKNANPAIEKFFEDVLVMDKDPAIKENRLAMLGMLKKKYNLIADFSALQI